MDDQAHTLCFHWESEGMTRLLQWAYDAGQRDARDGVTNPAWAELDREPAA